MTRRNFIARLGGMMLLVPRLALAQTAPGRRPRSSQIQLGYLGVASAGEGSRGAAAFEAGLRDLGYEPGDSVRIHYRWADGHYDRLPALAESLAAAGAELIVAPSAMAALAAKSASDSIPVVFSVVSEPVELGLVDSLAHPGGRLTGLAYELTADVIAKQVQYLGEVRPNFRKLAVIFNPDNRGNRRLLDGLKQDLGHRGIVLQPFGTRGSHDVDEAFLSFRREGSEAVLILAEPVLTELRVQIGARALDLGLPAAASSREDLVRGILLSYGANRLELIRRSARYVHRILQGDPPSDLPVQQPLAFDLVINLGTARALGITVPASLLAAAQDIID